MFFSQFSNPERYLLEYTHPVRPDNSDNAPTSNFVGPNKNIVPQTNRSKLTKKSPMQGPTTQTITAEEAIPILADTPSVTKERYSQIVAEYMDLTDIDTVQQVCALDEAEQNTFLISLTNRLYQMIIGKVSDIDYGDIPSTKGNIRKLPKYRQMRECIEILHNIFLQYKEDTKPVDEIDNALSNLENYSDLFISSYSGDIEFGIMTYETVSLGVVTSIGFMIAVCIEYVKDPKKQGLSIVLKKTGVSKVKDFIVYENLIKFNETCKRGDLERALRPLIKNKVKNMFENGLSLLHVVIAVPVILVAVIPFLKHLTYFFYSTRERMSTYLDAQSDLLKMNAAELKSNDNIKTESDKKKVIERQLAIASFFSKTANKIAIKSKEGEIKATREIKADSKSLKMDQVESNPANIGSVSGPLF